MAKGLLYFAQNSAFQHLTKIGMTTKIDVENRGLSASNVPEDFNYLAVFECDNVEWAEKKVHEQFANFRHYTATDRKTEFFWSGCVKNAIKYVRDLKGVHDKTDDETEEIEVADESGEKQVRKVAAQTTFDMIQLPVGTTIHFKNDKNKAASIADNKNQVIYKGQQSSISNLALKLERELGGNSKHINGFAYFYYDNKTLFEMRPDQKDKE